MPAARSSRRALFCALLAFAIAAPAALAQNQSAASFQVQRDALVSPARLLAPAEFLGYDLGERFTPHHLVVDYVMHVAAASPRVSAEVYGMTHEGRPLLLVTAASPERMARIDGVREDHLRRAGFALGTPASADAPAVAWLSYNVHGNESVSTEAAMQVLYDLADEGNARTSAWLANTVVLLDPCLNPDGRERYVQWYTRTRGAQPDADPDAREHSEPWPGGRANHYYFDLNRDWAWGSQPETRARLAAYQRWMPHLHADYHEQGVNSPYYFAPAAEPFHDAITPFQRDFQNRVGATNARDFDADGRLYFTRESFDLLYPGYGDTWPTFAGAVGMTYEQGGSGRAGLAVETAEGDTLTLAQRIAGHHTTSMGTLETVSGGAIELVAQMQAYVQGALDAEGTPYHAIALRGDARRLAALGEHLRMQGIEFGYATSSATRRGQSYRTGETRSASIAAGDMVVSLHQPRGTLARVLFEPEAALGDSLTYDMTAWALPYLYDLDGYALTERLEPGSATPPADARAQPAPLPARPYAYLAEYRAFADAQFLADLLKQGVAVRVAMRPFRMMNRDYAPGTLIVTRRGNERLGQRFDALVREAAARHGQPLAGTPTGFAETGADFGSREVAYLSAPRVGLLLGEGLSPYSGGAAWNYFEQQLGYPVTVIAPDDFGRIDLGDYDVLVLPSGSYGDMLTESRLEEVRAWVRGGGKLVAIDRAASFFAGRDGFALETRDDDDSTRAPDFDRRYADRERERISGDVPGAFFQARVDLTHPLAFGFGETLPILRTGSSTLPPLKDGWNVVRLVDGDPLLAGFAGSEALAEQAGSLAVGVEDLGRGQIIYFADEPNFRGFWYAGKLLMANAVFLSGQD